MEFLTKAYGQLAELLRSMTPAARVTTGLLLGVIVVSLAFLFRQGTETQANEYLFGARVLTDAEIADMSAAFSTAGLNDWSAEQNRIRVPRSQRHTYLAALTQANALPRDAGKAWEEMFKSQSYLDNRKLQDLRALRALERELSIILRATPGIEGAEVKIEEIQTREFPPRAVRRAVATVQTESNRPLDESQVRMVRYLVAYGGGVEREEVVVIDGHGVYPGPSKNGVPNPEDNPYLIAQHREEQLLQQKIQEHLKMVPGAIVSAYVQLEEKLEDRVTKVTYDDKPANLQTSNYTKETTSSNKPEGGRPGAEPNAVGNRSVEVAAGSASESTSNETHEEQRAVYGVTHTETLIPGLTTKHVQVWVQIPRSHFLRVWRERSPGAEADPGQPDPTELKTIENEEIAAIENGVTALLPPTPLGVDKFPRVTVTTYSDLNLPPPAAPAMSEVAMSWLGANWQTLGLFGLALFGVFFLRGMLQTGKPQRDTETEVAEAPDGSPAARMAELSDDEESVEDLANSLRGRFQGSGRSLREELAELVREDPDAAAHVLQGWISDAA